MRFCILFFFITGHILCQTKEYTMEKEKIIKTEKEWRNTLSPEEYRILREKGTERAFTGKYDNYFEKGTYSCAGCGNQLFVSETKYNSGCGWPAFLKQFLKKLIKICTPASLRLWDIFHRFNIIWPITFIICVPQSAI